MAVRIGKVHPASAVAAVAHSAVRTWAITIFTFNITFGAAWPVLVLYVRERPGMGAAGIGRLTTRHGRGELAAPHPTAGLSGASRWARSPGAGSSSRP